MNEFITLLNDALQEDTFIRCIWSNPRNKDQYTKLVLKPIQLKDGLYLQMTKSKDNKEYHENFSYKEIISQIEQNAVGYKQIQLYTSTNDYQCLINKKGHAHIKKLAPSMARPTSLAHNRQKKIFIRFSFISCFS